MRIVFKVPGEIAPWARAGRFGQRSFTPRKQRRYMDAIRSAAKDAHAGPPFEGAVRMLVMAIYPWPKSMSKRRRAEPDAAWKCTRPDDDNIAKICKDAIQPTKDGSFAGLVTDDAQCAHTSVWKIYGNRPGLTVELSSLAGVAAPVC
jgi:Holliday junction resolvase RusA-like endonuclease